MSARESAGSLVCAGERNVYNKWSTTHQLFRIVWCFFFFFFSSFYIHKYSRSVKHTDHTMMKRFGPCDDARCHGAQWKFTERMNLMLRCMAVGTFSVWPPSMRQQRIGMLGGTSLSRAHLQVHNATNEMSTNEMHVWREKNHIIRCDCHCHCSCDEAKLTRRQIQRFDYEKTCNVNAIVRTWLYSFCSCVCVFDCVNARRRRHHISNELSMLCFYTCLCV